MASYRQLPERLRRLQPRFKTPWLAIGFFGGVIPVLVVLPGKTGFLGDMYAFGAMLSFTIAHLAVIALRVRRPDEELVFRARPNIRFRGIDWPVFAVLGGIGTGIAWIVTVVQKPEARWAGLGWLAIGLLAYSVYRGRVLKVALTETMRAPLQFGPSIALEYRSILVPVVEGHESEEAVDVACRLAAERRATIAAIRVLVVPLELPLDTPLPDAGRRANELLDEARAVGDSYGLHVVGRIVRARDAGRAIVDEAERRQAEIVVMGSPRARHRRTSAIFGKTVDFVLKNAPCRVMVVAARRAAA
jgi:APA family basic amino acid/polyamine antiporter